MILSRCMADTNKAMCLRDFRWLKGLRIGGKSLHELVPSNDFVGHGRFQHSLLSRHWLMTSRRRIHSDASTKTSSSGQEDQASWWKGIMTMSQVVPNSGSIARDILAAERTFLAWSRTGLGFVGAGTALFTAFHQSNEWSGRDKMNTKGDDAENGKRSAESSATSSSRLTLDHLHFYPTLAAALLVGNGAFLLAFATRRYLRTVTLMTRNLDQGLFPIDTKGTLMAVAVTASSTLASLGLVLSMATDSVCTTNPRQS